MTSLPLKHILEPDCLSLPVVWLLHKITYEDYVTACTLDQMWSDHQYTIKPYWCVNLISSLFFSFLFSGVGNGKPHNREGIWLEDIRYSTSKALMVFTVITVWFVSWPPVTRHSLSIIRCWSLNGERWSLSWLAYMLRPHVIWRCVPLFYRLSD